MRWAIVGVGVAGRARVSALRALDEPIVAVFRGRYISSLDLLAVNSLDEAIERADVVAIASPPEVHAHQVRAALDAGRHLVVDSPLATSVAEADALFALARSRSCVLHVEHIERLSPTTRVIERGVAHDPPRSLSMAMTLSTAFDTPARHALAQIPRLHRIEALAGEVVSVSVEACTAERIAVAMRTVRGCEVRLESSADPRAERCLRARLMTEAGVLWEIDGRTVLRDGVPETSEPTPLFLEDTRLAIEEILGKCAPYVSERAILRALALAEQLGEGRTGFHLPDARAT